MSQDEAIIKGALDFILTNTFNDPDRFKSYFVRIVPKELTTKHGHYKSKTRLIEIFNLAREPRFTLLTCLHELAHHVEYEELGMTDHDTRFFEIFHQLILTAIGLNYLDQYDITEEDDSSDYMKLSKYFGEVSDWEIPIFPSVEKRMVVVKNGYDYRHTLKNRNFQWHSISQTWEKEFANQEEAVKEKEILLEFGENEDILIQPLNQLTFLTYYYIGIENGYEYRYGLKDLGYLWEGYNVKNMWVKKVDATAFYREIRKLTTFAGIEYKKVTPKPPAPPKKKKKANAIKKVIEYYV